MSFGKFNNLTPQLIVMKGVYRIKVISITTNYIPKVVGKEPFQRFQSVLPLHAHMHNSLQTLSHMVRHL